MRRPVVAGNWKMNPASASRSRRAGADRRRGGSRPGYRDDRDLPADDLAGRGRACRQPRRESVRRPCTSPMRAPSPVRPARACCSGLAGFVILGHSERRQYDGETDDGVGRKVVSAVAHGLRPIAAVGERADERSSGTTAAVIDRQVRAALGGLERLAGTGLVIAYEPVWAIGTGDAATAGRCPGGLRPDSRHPRRPRPCRGSRDPDPVRRQRDGRQRRGAVRTARHRRRAGRRRIAQARCLRRDPARRSRLSPRA